LLIFAITKLAILIAIKRFVSFVNSHNCFDKALTEIFQFCRALFVGFVRRERWKKFYLKLLNITWLIEIVVCCRWCVKQKADIFKLRRIRPNSFEFRIFDFQMSNLTIEFSWIQFLDQIRINFNSNQLRYNIFWLKKIVL